MTLIAKPNNKRCFAPCDTNRIQSGQCTCNNQHDRKVMIIGADNLTGCQRIQLQLLSINIGVAFEELNQSFLSITESIQRTCEGIEMRQALIKDIHDLGFLENKINQRIEKKQKYIRQQHKWAQRNYRGK